MIIPSWVKRVTKPNMGNLPMGLVIEPVPIQTVFYPYIVAQLEVKYHLPLAGHMSREVQIAVDAITGAVALTPNGISIEEADASLNHVLKQEITVNDSFMESIKESVLPPLLRKMRILVPFEMSVRNTRRIYKEIRLFRSCHGDSSYIFYLDTVTGGHALRPMSSTLEKDFSS